jgi:hypothetical protein
VQQLMMGDLLPLHCSGIPKWVPQHVVYMQHALAGAASPMPCQTCARIIYANACCDCLRR